jgi:hypothetical protein
MNGKCYITIERSYIIHRFLGQQATGGRGEWEKGRMGEWEKGKKNS